MALARANRLLINWHRNSGTVSICNNKDKFMEKLVPIKNIAGDMLLYFYSIQRRNKFSLEKELIRFDAPEDEDVTLEGDSEFEKNILKISGNNANDALNALNYLGERRFVEFHNKQHYGGAFLHGLRILSSGVDIIEGIERGRDEKEAFHVTFNIKLADNINVESLVKNELGSLLSLTKVGLL